MGYRIQGTIRQVFTGEGRAGAFLFVVGPFVGGAGYWGIFGGLPVLLSILLLACGLVGSLAGVVLMLVGREQHVDVRAVDQATRDQFGVNQGFVEERRWINR